MRALDREILLGVADMRENGIGDFQMAARFAAFHVGAAITISAQMAANDVLAAWIDSVTVMLALRAPNGLVAQRFLVGFGLVDLVAKALLECEDPVMLAVITISR